MTPEIVEMICVVFLVVCIMSFFGKICSILLKEDRPQDAFKGIIKKG